MATLIHSYPAHRYYRLKCLLQSPQPLIYESDGAKRLHLLHQGLVNSAKQNRHRDYLGIDRHGLTDAKLSTLFRFTHVTPSTQTHLWFLARPHYQTALLHRLTPVLLVNEENWVCFCRVGLVFGPHEADHHYQLSQPSNITLWKYKGSRFTANDADILANWGANGKKTN